MMHSILDTLTVHLSGTWIAVIAAIWTFKITATWFAFRFLKERRAALVWAQQRGRADDRT